MEKAVRRIGVFTSGGDAPWYECRHPGSGAYLSAHGY